MIYVLGFPVFRLETQKLNIAKIKSTMNSKTSNIIATDIPRYNDKEPPIAPVKAVSWKWKFIYFVYLKDK